MSQQSHSLQLTRGQRVTKRLLDIVLTVLLSPLLVVAFALIAVLIKFDSDGSVLFRQERIGRDNQKFLIVKFRTMHAHTVDHEAREVTSRRDPRITRLGKLLRRTSLDEIPQFWNVLLGDMSIVGPRPHAEQTKVENALLWEIDDAYWKRHAVKPGITGLAQVRGHRGSLFKAQQLKDRLRADLEYLENWSLTDDIKIILRTTNVLAHRNAF